MTRAERKRLLREERKATITEFGEIPVSQEELDEMMRDQDAFRELQRDRRSEGDAINSDEL